MKNLLQASIIIFLFFISFKTTVTAQNILVTPTKLCDGDQVNIVINPSLLPAGKTFAYYKFYLGNGSVITSSLIGINYFTFFGCPPGNWTSGGELVTTDSTHINAGTASITIYYLPSASFNITSKDTQCFKGNSFCFTNTSVQNTHTPSNPLAKNTWFFGDATIDSIHTSTVCHTYDSAMRYDVNLVVTDNFGCTSNAHNPTGYVNDGVFLFQPLHIDFSWAQISGPCFGSGYIFKNKTSSTPINKVKNYTWDFGDSTSYSSTSAFNALQKSHYDTISHKYFLERVFHPSLIITDTFGCIDTLKKTYYNTDGVLLPYNIFTDMKFTKSLNENSNENMDSFCVGSSLAEVYFNKYPIAFANAGAGDFVWNFGDPNDPNNKNLDSLTFNPSHIFSGVGKYKIKFTVKNICKDTSVFDSIEVLGPKAIIENASINSIISNAQKFQCDGNDTVDFVNNSAYYKSKNVKRLWDFDDDFAPLCTAYSVPKNSSFLIFADAQQQYNNSNHFYITNGVTYTGKMNCKYSNDSLPRHLYTNWDSVYYWYVNGKTFPASWNKPSITANTPITITSTKPVPDPFWQAQGRLVNLTTGTLRNKFDSITYTIPGFGTFKRYGNQLLPNSNITFHEYVFRYVINRGFTISLTLKDSLNHASASTISCASVNQILLSHGKPDAHGLSITGRQCPGLFQPGMVEFNLRATGIGAGTKPSCGQTYIYVNLDSLADRMDNTPSYLDGFTTWGTGDFGTTITPGPGQVTTPGGLLRNTFYSLPNWNPNPPSPWKSADRGKFVYHYGGNAGTPPPADTAQGFITIGIFLGSGIKDTLLQIWKSNYDVNKTNSGGILIDNFGRLYNPITSLPFTYQDIQIVKTIVNKATPPPDFIYNGWIDDSISFNYNWKGIIKSTPQIRYTTPTIIWDTLLTLQYVDDRYPKCVSDTVWYHNFIHISELNPLITKSPAELATLREVGDTMSIIYRDEVQDSVKTTVYTWGDGIATIDSFYYAGYDTTNGYYTHGFRRVRYNVDYTNGLPGLIIDSTVWPCGIYGQKQYQQPIKLFSRIFDVIGTIAPDTFILRNKFPSTTHFDKWYPYTNYHDTIHLRMRDTMRYTEFNIIDTSLMLLPVSHQYKKTSWEINPSGKVAGAIITQMSNFSENTQKCQYSWGGYPITIGVIDSLHIYGDDWKEDSVFCTNEKIHFIDSVRYFRYDDQITDVPNLNFGRSRGLLVYFSNPYLGYQFDTIDFWARDADNSSDTLAYSDYTNSFLLNFIYKQGQWTNWNLDYTGAITHLPSPTGHWDVVLRGGNVSVVAPSSITDSAGIIPKVGTVIYCPASYGGLGNAGHLFVWSNSGWVPTFNPITIDSLNSLTDVSKTPIPAIGKTTIYNKGKGNIKRIGTYYWNGTQWIFVANSPYNSFPYYTHRLYWNFGDGSPIYQGVKPTHVYNNPGTYTVSMISRDSIGHFDTCISIVNISGVIAKPVSVSGFIGCEDSAAFIDSSIVPPSSSTIIVSRKWFFGDNKLDTLTPQSVVKNPIYKYSHNGLFKVKLISLANSGCSSVGYTTIKVDGPRPMFRVISNTSGCKPLKVGILNLADSAGKTIPADTPTILTTIFWGDGTQINAPGRHDTLWHTYTNAGTFAITAAGRNADIFHTPTCPIVFYPDTLSGEVPINVKVTSSNIGKIAGDINPHINDVTNYSVVFELNSTITWSVPNGIIQSGLGTNTIQVKWPSTSGIYYVKAQKVNSKGCYDYDSLMVHVLMTSVKDLSSIHAIKLFPNPTNNEVTISLNSLKPQDLMIKIYDVLGKVCMSDLIKGASAQISKNYSVIHLNHGIYFVEISSNEEKTIVKLIVE